MLGKSLAGEWASKGVRVNVLSPGYVLRLSVVFFRRIDADDFDIDF